MPTCLEETDVLEDSIDCYDDLPTAIENTHLIFCELLGDLDDARRHIRTTLAYCIRGDDGEIIEPDAWPAALDPKRAALIAILARIEESFAIAQAQMAIGPSVDDRIDRLERQVRELQRELGVEA